MGPFVTFQRYLITIKRKLKRLVFKNCPRRRVLCYHDHGKVRKFVVLISDTLVEGNKCMYLLLKRKSYVQTDATTPNIVGSTTLGVVASVLVVVGKGMQQLPAMLGPAVHCGKDTTQKTLETTCNSGSWPQQCWKSCANGSNIVALRFGDHGTKEILEVVGSKV